MGTSIGVQFLREKDEKYTKYAEIFKACKENNISIPKEIDEYFGGYGVDNNLEERLEVEFEPREFNKDYQSGYEIDIEEIPEDVKTIRFLWG